MELLPGRFAARFWEGLAAEEQAAFAAPEGSRGRFSRGRSRPSCLLRRLENAVKKLRARMLKRLSNHKLLGWDHRLR